MTASIVVGFTATDAGADVRQAMKRPAFFRGETLGIDAPESLRRARS